MIGLLIAIALQEVAAEPPADAPERQDRLVRVEAERFPGLQEPRTVGCLSLLSGLTLTSPSEEFGGLSDIALTGDGFEALIVSDDANALRGTLVIDEEGRVTGLSGVRSVPLISQNGTRLNKVSGDAEAVVALGSGYAVTLEGDDRLVRMDLEGRFSEVQRAAEEDRRVLRGNSGFEALARLKDGRLVAISEGKDAAGLAIVRRGSPETRFAQWLRASYRPADDFNVTSADVDPLTGDLFVLERAFSPMRGPRMRVVRVPAHEVGEELIEGEELTRMGLLEGVDNMEGLAVIRRPDASLRLVLVSDDNFSAAQRTVLLTLGLAPNCQDGEPAQTAFGGDPATQEPVEADEDG